MKQHFINELDSLRTQITAQGELAERAIHNAIQAFSTGDTELARRVMAHDEIIDREEIRLEEECLKVLALYQPVAGDLRTVISCIKINTALERIGDFGSHIAERAIMVAELPILPEQEVFDFSPMEVLTMGMLHDTLHAIQHSDLLLAHKVIDRDDAVDAMRSEHRAHARAAILRCPAAVEYYVSCIGLARDLERIADLATDICRQLIYLRTGCITRHKSA
ncbi:MAG: phosphate signaling complex protein PhoU [Akkermansia sp.]|nr:phosphate signaling complex protein PhoU [Akkermansia sp.]